MRCLIRVLTVCINTEKKKLVRNKTNLTPLNWKQGRPILETTEESTRWQYNWPQYSTDFVSLQNDLKNPVWIGDIGNTRLELMKYPDGLNVFDATITIKEPWSSPLPQKIIYYRN